MCRVLMTPIVHGRVCEECNEKGARTLGARISNSTIGSIVAAGKYSKVKVASGYVDGGWRLGRMSDVVWFILQHEVLLFFSL